MMVPEWCSEGPTNRPVPCQSPGEAPLKGRGRVEQRVQVRNRKDGPSGPRAPSPICTNCQLRGLLSNEIEWGRLETQCSARHSEKERCDSVLKTCKRWWELRKSLLTTPMGPIVLFVDPVSRILLAYPRLIPGKA